MPHVRSVNIRAERHTQTAFGPDHPNVGTSLNNLAELYANQGQYAQAEPLYKRSLAIFEKALHRTSVPLRYTAAS